MTAQSASPLAGASGSCSSLPFPGSRSLAGWWQKLAPHRPQAIWCGHLLLHQVEALVRLARTCRPTPFHLWFLKALALAPEQALQALDERLHLGAQFLVGVLRELQVEGLAQAGAPGTWTLTALGRQALDQGEYHRPSLERRRLYFVESERPRRLHYLNLDAPVTVPWTGGEGSPTWHFDVQALLACPGRPEAWKRQHGFPLEVQEVLATGTDWRRVILDRPQQMLAVLVLKREPEAAEDPGVRLLGFPARQDGWVLQTAQPVFCLGADWPEVFPELAEEPSLETWRQALQAWCRMRGLLTAETETCCLQREGHLLRVEATGRLLDRLRSRPPGRSDALKGEAWVLAGEGRVRKAAQLAVVEGGRLSPAASAH